MRTVSPGEKSQNWPGRADWERMTREEIPVYLADLFSSLGYQVKWPGPETEGVVDLVLQKGWDVIAVSVANLGKPVMARDLEKLFSVRSLVRANKAVCVAFVPLTLEAAQFARLHAIDVYDIERIFAFELGLVLSPSGASRPPSLWSRVSRKWRFLLVSVLLVVLVFVVSLSVAAGLGGLEGVRKTCLFLLSLLGLSVVVLFCVWFHSEMLRGIRGYTWMTKVLPGLDSLFILAAGFIFLSWFTRLSSGEKMILILCGLWGVYRSVNVWAVKHPEGGGD